ncbi:MAG: DUF2147 domain-containing protein [Gammaproteobacteria bacterium]|nr:MAG: DUF2147 domain-containing protein [Gammaproteobacteria bacterium]UTW41393.1 DUF2147 domain-containing protein [bacterium SCSIO 12844]
MRISKLVTLSVTLGICAAFNNVLASVDQFNSAQTKDVKESKKSHILSPIGYWLQYSDKTGKAQSVFQVYEDTKTGKVEGKILVPFFKLVNSEVTPPDINCGKCGKGSDNGYTYDYTKMPDSRVQGMKLLWGFTKTDDKPSQGDGIEWDDGSLLDPESGHVYSGYLYTQNWGRELYLRGYWGISLIGRTQVWKRITKFDADRLVKQCGLVSDGTHYTYTNTGGKIANEKLWKSCSNIKL